MREVGSCRPGLGVVRAASRRRRYPREVGIDSSRVAAAGECVCKSILGRGQLVGLDLDAEIDAECGRKAEELSQWFVCGSLEELLELRVPG